MTVRVRLDDRAPEPAPKHDPAFFEEAVKAWRSKVPLTEEQFDALVESAQAKAFTVAEVADLDLVSDVWRALDSAIARGTTFADFKAEIGEKLQQAWGDEDAWRLETVFRTNVQVAYNAGRYAAQTNPAVLKRRPFWKFSAVLDSRTSPFCKPLSGVVVRADDPWWDTHQPPLHFGCRSTVIALTAEQGEAAAVDGDDAPELEADDGFGAAPRMSDWEPDLSDVPAPLRAAFERAKASR